MRNRWAHLEQWRFNESLNKGCVVTGNEAGQEDHMANTNRYRVLCSSTKQTRKRGTKTRQTEQTEENPGM